MSEPVKLSRERWEMLCAWRRDCRDYVVPDDDGTITVDKPVCLHPGNVTFLPAAYALASERTTVTASPVVSDYRIHGEQNSAIFPPPR